MEGMFILQSLILSLDCGIFSNLLNQAFHISATPLRLNAMSVCKSVFVSYVFYQDIFFQNFTSSYQSLLVYSSNIASGLTAHICLFASYYMWVFPITMSTRVNSNTFQNPDHSLCTYAPVHVLSVRLSDPTYLQYLLVRLMTDVFMSFSPDYFYIVHSPAVLFGHFIKPK